MMLELAILLTVSAGARIPGWIPGMPGMTPAARSVVLGQGEEGVHEIDDAAHGERGGLGGGLADEATALSLVERKVDLTTALPVALHEALEVGLGVDDVIRSLHVKHGWHLGLLAAI